MAKSLGQKMMTFPEAIQQVIYGRKLTRVEWHDANTCIFLAGGFLVIQKSDGIFRLTPSEGDMFATDWVMADLNA